MFSNPQDKKYRALQSAKIVKKPSKIISKKIESSIYIFAVSN